MRELLIAKRKALGLSQGEMAQRVCISQASYCNYERGKRNPTVKNAKRIAKILGCTVDELLEGVE